MAAMSEIRWDAQTYDRVSDPQVRWGVVVLDRLELRGDEVVLDAGCGSGRLTEMLVQRLPRGRAIGVDSSPAMAATARARLGKAVPIVVADMGAPVPFAPACADAVFSTATFHWVRDQEALYRNLAHMIRPGGRLVAQCGGHGNIASVIEAVRAEGGAPLEPWVFLDPADARALLEDNGFVDVEAWLQPEPTQFDTVEELATFLSTCVLNPWLGGLSEQAREPFARAVAARLPSRRADYVRLNLVARRA